MRKQRGKRRSKGGGQSVYLVIILCACKHTVHTNTRTAVVPNNSNCGESQARAGEKDGDPAKKSWEMLSVGPTNKVSFPHSLPWLSLNIYKIYAFKLTE